MKLSSDQLKELLERNSTIARLNPDLFGAPSAAPIRPVEPQPVKRNPLVRRVRREKESGPCFEIVFTVYAVRPCDYDGYHVKPLQDFIVHAGILPGDSWHQLEGRVYSRKVHTEEEEKTTVEIRRIR